MRPVGTGIGGVWRIGGLAFEARAFERSLARWAAGEEFELDKVWFPFRERVGLRKEVTRDCVAFAPIGVRMNLRRWRRS